jgi:Tfp pilus assembly protein PilN
MVNIGLALKELLPEKEGANFSVVSFNALPEIHIPPRFSMVRVLIPVVTVIGIGLIIFAVILILNNRADIASLRPEVASAETRITQLQRDVTQLGASIASAKGAADVLSNTLVDIERGRAVILSDLREITRLAGQSVSLGSVSHVGNSVTISGTTTNVDYLFRYARALRESKDSANAPRFSSIWVSKVGSGFSFEFSLTK